MSTASAPSNKDAVEAVAQEEGPFHAHKPRTAPANVEGTWVGFTALVILIAISLPDSRSCPPQIPRLSPYELDRCYQAVTPAIRIR